MAETPETRYTKSGDIHIAYQVIGKGPLDLVYVPGFVSHLEYQWEEPRWARMLRRLASFSRLISFDKPGTGLSDRLAAIPTLEQRMDDMRAVNTVKDLVAGSGIGLKSRGTHVLRGVPGEWPLFVVAGAA